MTSIKYLLPAIPTNDNGYQYSVTCKSGPLGLSVVDTMAGFCMLDTKPDKSSQTDQGPSGPSPGDFIIAVGGQSLGVTGFKGVKGLTKLLKSKKRPVVLDFFRFKTVVFKDYF